MKTSVTANDLCLLLDTAVKNGKVSAAIELAKEWALAAEEKIEGYEAMKVRIAVLEKRIAHYEKPRREY